MKRTLALKREPLAELSTEELTAVNGAADDSLAPCWLRASELRCYLSLSNCIATCVQ